MGGATTHGRRGGLGGGAGAGRSWLPPVQCRGAGVACSWCIVPLEHHRHPHHHHPGKDSRWGRRWQGAATLVCHGARSDWHGQGLGNSSLRTRNPRVSGNSTIWNFHQRTFIKHLCEKFAEKFFGKYHISLFQLSGLSLQ